MYKERRKALASTLPNTAIALVCSGKAPYKVGDEKYDFSVDRSFYYLTGLDKENMVLAIIKVEGRVSEYLFIERYDEELAKWVGGRIMPKDAANISGIQEIYWREEAMDTIGSVLSRYFSGYANVDVYADFTKQEAEQADSEAHIFARSLLQRYPHIVLHDLAGYISALRLVKDEDELAKLQKAIAVTKEAIENMMAHAHAGMGEYELEAYFDFVLKSNNCLHSFPSIVAGGKMQLSYIIRRIVKKSKTALWFYAI